MACRRRVDNKRRKRHFCLAGASDSSSFGLKLGGGTALGVAIQPVHNRALPSSIVASSHPRHSSFIISKHHTLTSPPHRPASSPLPSSRPAPMPMPRPRPPRSRPSSSSGSAVSRRRLVSPRLAASCRLGKLCCRRVTHILVITFPLTLPVMVSPVFTAWPTSRPRSLSSSPRASRACA